MTVFGVAKLYWDAWNDHGASFGLRQGCMTDTTRDRPKPRRLPNAGIVVPSFFTLLNLLCGFLAITQVHDGQYLYACYLIILAGLFDLLDGMLARLTHGQSLFGVELDSLSDIVSFGVAPAYLIYVLFLEAAGTFGHIVAALPILCAAVRLARFNVSFDSTKKDYFEGLPVPVQAYFLVALTLNVESNAWLSNAGFLTASSVIPAMVVLSVLMVSSISFDGVPRITFANMRRYPAQTVIYLSALAIFVFLPLTGLLLVLAVYLLTGITKSVIGTIRNVMVDASREK